MDAPPTISLRQVRFRRSPAFELKVPSLTVARGERVAVVGPSGSGKSTLLGLLAGWWVPDGGLVSVAGVTVSGLAEAARRAFRLRHVGQVFDEPQLIETASVLDNVLLPLRLDPATALGEAEGAFAGQLLEDLGLGAHAKTPAGHLSRGHRQAVAVARALVTRPAVVLADEPTAFLDARDAGRVLDRLLQRLAPEQTLLMVTHEAGSLHRFQRTLELEAP